MQAAAQALLPIGQVMELASLVPVYYNRGRVHEQQKRYEKALEAYEQALRLLDAEQEVQGYEIILHDIADVYYAQGQLEPALEYYQRAAEAKERGDDPSDLVTTLQALAEVQMELRQTTEALRVYEKCLALLRGLPAPGEPGQLAAVYDGLGRAHEQEEQQGNGQPGDDPQQGGLAAARGAEDAGELAGGHGEIEPRQGDGISAIAVIGLAPDRYLERAHPRHRIRRRSSGRMTQASAARTTAMKLAL